LPEAEEGEEVEKVRGVRMGRALREGDWK